MTEVIDKTPSVPPTDPATPAALDLTTAIQRVLAASDEPMTVSKIRAKLPGSLRGTDTKDLTDLLERQVSANVLFKYPKYRSPQDRYWDRGMNAHVGHLVRSSLESGPLSWSELRRKLPAYAQGPAQQVLDEQIAQGLLHRHPRAGSRGGERFSHRPPDPRDYLRQELPDLFTRLTALGFTRPQIRAAALELLHEEEWDVEPPPKPPEPEETNVPEASQSTPIRHGDTHPNTPGAAQAP
jgi:hypothetical protein